MLDYKFHRNDIKAEIFRLFENVSNLEHSTGIFQERG